MYYSSSLNNTLQCTGLLRQGFSLTFSVKCHMYDITKLNEVYKISQNSIFDKRLEHILDAAFFSKTFISDTSLAEEESSVQGEKDEK